MKKIYVLAICAAFALNTSCKKNDEKEDEIVISGSLNVEEGKKQLEQNSINFLNKIESLKDDTALNEMIDLAEFLNNPSPNANTFEKSFYKTLSNVSELNNKDVNAFNTKQAIALVDEKPLLSDFNNEKGIYTWNSNTEEFDFTGPSDDIVYNFSYDNGKNATFTVTDFNTEISENEELPTLAKANLKIDNITVFNQEFSASINKTQLLPNTVKNTTSIGGFSFISSYDNSNNKEINETTEIKINNEVITSFKLNLKGNFNNENGTVIEDFIDNSAITFKFLDAALTMNIKDSNFDSNKEYSIDDQIALLNSNSESELSVNGKSVAKGEFYKDKDTYKDYVFNPSTSNYEYKEVTDDVVNMRLLFADNTTSDFNTYIDGSFTELESKFESVFKSFENLFDSEK